MSAQGGYTLLRATPGGIVLGAYHARRFPPDEQAAFWSRTGCLAPGVWAIRRTVDDLQCEPRAASRLRDGMPVRLLPSPLSAADAAVGKPAPPCRFDAVRLAGVATLLTSPDGAEIYEACSAAVLGWDGEQLLRVPDGRPRVWSTAEAAIRDHLPTREAVFATRSTTPLLLVNAVKGTCTVHDPARRPFPAAVIDEIDGVLQSLTVRAPSARSAAGS